MGTHFLFPANPMRPAEVDAIFADQLAAVRDAGFTTSVFAEKVLTQGRPLRDVPPGATMVYRGWMLNATQYARLAEAIVAALATPLTAPEAYLAAHHLPNWYPRVAEFTPETRVLSSAADLEAELRSIGWDAFFVKDYVKSLKTARGAIVRDPAEIGALVEEMREFRGTIEGGLCVRRVEAFVPESERRYFVIGGRAFTPDNGPVPEIVRSVAGRIPSPFFSVDVADRADGVARVVEVGDGQVSDLVGWTAGEFAAMWREAAPGGAEQG